MKKPYIMLVAVALLLLLVLALAACQPATGGGDETSADAGETTVEETTSKKTDAKEKETGPEQLPRFDYFSADMNQFVDIDPSVYEDMKVTLAADLQITEAEVERYIIQLRFQERGAAEAETVVDEILEWGDDAYIYYTGYVDGEVFKNGSNVEDKEPFALGLGSADFIPGFEEGLVGVIPSRTSKENPVKLNLRFPTWYRNQQLAGKEVLFEVYVVYGIKHEMPEYTVDFVEKELMYKFKKDNYVSDDAKLAEFEEYVKKHLDDSMKDTVKEKTMSAMWDYLLEAVTFKSMPEPEITYYRSSYMNRFEQSYDYYKSYGYKGDFDAFVREMMGLGKDGDWEAEMMRVVEENVKFDIIRYAVAQLEDMRSVTDEEMEEEIRYWIDYYEENYQTTVTKADVLENLGEVALRRTAFTEKMNDFLLEHVTAAFESAESEGSADAEPVETESAAEETTAA